MQRNRALVPAALLAALLAVACGADAWSAQTHNKLPPPGDEAPDAAKAAGGDFDWCVPSGQYVIFDTTTSTVLGGPHCAASTAKTFVGGVVDVRHFLIEPGASLRVLGPNPFLLRASGTVRIEGTLDLSGNSNPGVLTLNTTSVAEPGAPGQAGGGRGGTGSPRTTASSPRGDPGFGAYNLPAAGGGGGETGWDNTSLASLHLRRGAGGGGGVFGPDQRQTLGPASVYGVMDQAFLGLDAEPGFSNPSGSYGAVTGASGPHGGRPGPSPFVDGNPSNDFYGPALELSTGSVLTGELPVPWAGAGGGGGGDASYVAGGGTFPPVPFVPTGDEKGAGGGGGGGSLEIQALGDIVFGPAGRILCRGGSGGGGENTIFLNRVGGGSGGGSGGHVILQTAGRIDFSRVQPGLVPGQLAAGILATGGQGGAGRNDLGGATVGAPGQLETHPALDACPPGYPAGGPNACWGPVEGAGGDGGPGVVQLHTRTGLDPSHPSILLPAGLTVADVCQPLPVGADGSIRLIPDFPGLGDALQGDPAPSETEESETGEPAGRVFSAPVGSLAGPVPR